MKNNLYSKKFQKDNRGMSLVEVLVAMIIFSITGVAFLQSFTYATNNNRLAKEKQHALVLAQSMMETVKAYGIDQMDDKNSSAYTNYTLGTKQDPVISDDEHVYQLKNVDYEGYKYDVKITATQSTGLNNSGIAGKIHMPASEADAEYLQPIESEQEAVLEAVWNAMVAEEYTNPGITDYLADGFSSSSFMDKSLIKCTERVQELIIDHDGTNYTVKAQAHYTVEVDSFEYIDQYGSAKNFSGLSSFTVDCPIKSVYSGAKLTSVYFYYYPAYKKVALATPPTNIYEQWFMCDSDVIQINNKMGNADANKVNVYLYKQKLPSLDSETIIQGFETVYSVIVQNAGTGPVWLYTNLTKNIYDKSNKASDFFAQGFLDKSKCVTTTHDRESSTLLYDVKVEVSKAGNSNVIFTLNGSTNDK